ncbi:MULTISPECIES: hypothetical protein [Bradyrhizobium]|uniref:Uncharacterized protein n=1 Tax=Bradyrhizobium elkanii TaxID=29448 RepID=A0A4U6RIL6_BRAEL|nr:MULTISPECIES: hypothetical protein [Bradyrhizobium]MTV18033.1 hypothetical protein [Bradyrhizobium sp. BR2003]TKV74317.1 hypothetical protein FDV58_33225 [Bradyrhizobium elkanii]
MATSLRGIAICQSKCLVLSLPSILPKDDDAKSRAAAVDAQLVQMFCGIILAYSRPGDGGL